MDSNNLLFWEKLDIPPPEAKMMKFKSDKASLIGGVFIEKIDPIISALENLPILHNEAALIARLIYRLKRRLSNDKGFKFLQLINSTLKRYRRLNLLGVLNSIRNHIQGSQGPSKAYYEWCLTSLLKFSCLFHRITELTTQAGGYFWYGFSSGKIWYYSLLFLGSLSRIRVLSEHMVREAAKWYSSLLPLLQYCSPDQPWLPSTASFPQSVPQLLDHAPYLTQKATAPALAARKKEETAENEEAVEMDTSETKPDANIKSIAFHEDCGVAISREESTEKKEKIPEKKLTKSLGLSNFNFLTDAKGVHEFLCRERVLRKVPGQLCLTQHLDEESWEKLDLNLSDLVRKMNRKRQLNENTTGMLHIVRNILMRTLLNKSKETDWGRVIAKPKRRRRQRH